LYEERTVMINRPSADFTARLDRKRTTMAM
jgi:hypothetical protein